MARIRARIGSGRHDLGERGVLAIVGGAEHHSVHVNQRQYPRKEKPALRSRALHVSTRKQTLSLSCGAATQLRRPQHAEPHLCLHRDPQTLRCVCAQSPMHRRSVSLSCRPYGRAFPATRPGVGEGARVRPCPAAKKEGGSLVRGTEESDRTAALALAQTEVRTGTVLPGSGGPEHQATRAVPQPTDTGSASHRLDALSEETWYAHTPRRYRRFADVLFQHPRLQQLLPLCPSTTKNSSHSSMSRLPVTNRGRPAPEKLPVGRPLFLWVAFRLS
jgi:hypothetical protein